MANPQHIEWLLEGVQSWNKRHEHQGFTPDLEHANIYHEFVERGALETRTESPGWGEGFR